MIYNIAVVAKHNRRYMIDMQRIVVDLDGTLALGANGQDYASVEPNLPLVERLRAYRADGFEIVIHTSRNMRTYNGEIGKINVHTLPVILAWLKQHNVPYDEIIVGKPWCGFDGFYVDDRAVRPDEFIALDYSQLRTRLGI